MTGIDRRDRQIESDELLLDRLRSGDAGAYEELWSRHIASALLVARRVDSRNAEDITSEAFLAVYNQVRAGGGPTSAFRAYLFTVIRNIAARNLQEFAKIAGDSHLESIADPEDASFAADSADEARTLLAAFRTLPDRWQRVLWLTEIEGRKRPAIAAELGLRPNAVSVLYRRARAGLREEWLTQQVPLALREDGTHAARLIPELVLGGASTHDRMRAKEHFSQCDACRTTYGNTYAAFRSRRKGALLITSGFAALGVVLPAATVAPVGTIAAAGAVGLGLVAAGAVTVVGGLLGLTVLVTPAPPLPEPTDPPTPLAQQQTAPQSQPGVELIMPAAAPLDPQPVPPSVPQLDVPTAPAVQATPTPAQGPDILLEQPNGAALPSDYPLPLPTPPAPSEPGAVPGPGDADPDAAPAVAASYPSTTYLAPVLGGTTAPDNEVAVQIEDDVYLATVVDEAWSLDLRTLALAAGEHSATVWSIAADGTTSAASTVSFSIAPLSVAGLEDGLLVDTSTEEGAAGQLFTVTAAPMSTVCVASDTGQSAMIDIGDQGTATRRMRFLSSGVYGLHFAVCDGEYFGPERITTVWASAGIFDPWADEPVFEIIEP